MDVFFNEDLVYREYKSGDDPTIYCFKLPDHLGVLMMTLRERLDWLGLNGYEQSGFPLGDQVGDKPEIPPGFPFDETEGEDDGELTDMDNRGIESDDEEGLGP